MSIQSEDDLRAIQEASAVRDMLNSTGWKLIEPVLAQKADMVRFKRDQSDDPSVVMACVRHEDGIMFVKEVIQEILSLGDEAAKLVAK